MARTMSYDQTDVYRMVVDYKYTQQETGRIFQDIYGPHASSGHARDHDKWRKGPARLRKQKLDIAMDGETLVWATIRATYANGGEGVNWDEDIRGA